MTPTSEEQQQQRGVLVLVSNQALKREVVANQRNAFTILSSAKIPYEVLDGADQDNQSRRNELFQISGLRAQYPQFFLVQQEQTTFFGDWEHFQLANDCGTLVQDLGFGAPSEPAHEPTLQTTIEEGYMGQWIEQFQDLFQHSKEKVIEIATANTSKITEFFPNFPSADDDLRNDNVECGLVAPADGAVGESSDKSEPGVAAFSSTADDVDESPFVTSASSDPDHIHLESAVPDGDGQTHDDVSVKCGDEPSTIESQAETAAPQADPDHLHLESAVPDGQTHDDVAVKCSDEPSTIESQVETAVPPADQSVEKETVVDAGSVSS